MTSNAIALDAPGDDRLDHIGTFALFGVAGALQFSIAAGQLLLAVAIAAWVGVLIVRREGFEAPRFFWVLVAYAVLTLASAVFSSDPRTSLIDCKQLVLFLLIPVVYRFGGGNRGST